MPRFTFLTFLGRSQYCITAFHFESLKWSLLFQKLRQLAFTCSYTVYIYTRKKTNVTKSSNATKKTHKNACVQIGHNTIENLKDRKTLYYNIFLVQRLGLGCTVGCGRRDFTTGSRCGEIRSKSESKSKSKGILLLVRNKSVNHKNQHNAI